MTLPPGTHLASREPAVVAVMVGEATSPASSEVFTVVLTEDPTAYEPLRLIGGDGADLAVRVEDVTPTVSAVLRMRLGALAADRVRRLQRSVELMRPQ